MTGNHYPSLDGITITDSIKALHVYAAVLGGWLKKCQPKRKHWWHASLRPSLNGLTTGVVHAEVDFEIELNLRESLLQCRTSSGKHSGKQLTEKLHGQPAAELADSIEQFLVANGMSKQNVPEYQGSDENTTRNPGYSAEHAQTIAEVISSVSSTMNHFRSGIREETSPIQLFPHHFDLSLLWLPGDKIADQDPANEEYADKQMNFGFTFGDEGIAEPYFYATAYPLPDAMPTMTLPPGTVWQSEGFSGAVLLYNDLVENNNNPNSYLLELWRALLNTGRENMVENTSEGVLV